MSDQINTVPSAFDTLCSFLTAREFAFKKEEDGNTVTFGMKGHDGLPIDFRINVDEKNKRVLLLSQLPFYMDEDSLLDGALAVCAINYNLAEGNFDYNLQNGAIVFRMSNTLRGCTPNEKTFEFMIVAASSIVDEFNEKLLKLQMARPI